MDMNTVMYPESGDAAMKMDMKSNGVKMKMDMKEPKWTIPLMLWFLQILRH
jgi:hypothetical protein